MAELDELQRLKSRVEECERWILDLKLIIDKHTEDLAITKAYLEELARTHKI